MKPDTYTKVMIAVVGAMLIVFALKPLVLPGTIASAQGQKSSAGIGRQAWEYKIIARSRGFKTEAGDGRWQAMEWNYWSEDQKELSLPVNIDAKLSQLGAQGWELVSVEPRSDKIFVHVDPKK
jgi:hypothetical protein